MADDKIFPLVDRRAPLLDRIRGDGEKASSVSEELGRRVGKFFKNDDEDIEAEELARSAEDFRRGLADELDVDEERITNEALDKFSELLTFDDLVEDVTDEDDEEEEEEEEETKFSFSDE